ncbi:TPA: hypothetical protein HA243_01335 [Candidatus Micrarchaeota archaeon]|nr:hypothetical protein [Candidatus Micrarchaeota archaeon]
MTSVAKKASNQKNALRSTGPKNVTQTRLNALQHGLTAEETVLDKSPFFESKADFRRLNDQFIQDLAPKNVAEAFLVQQMVQACWRLRRASKAENAFFREREKILIDEIVRKHTSGSLFAHHDLEKMSNAALTELKELAEGHLADLDAGKIDLSGYRGNEEFASMDENSLKNELRKMFNDQVRFFTALIGIREKNALDEYEDRIDSSTIPTENGLDAILRYRNSIQREFYTALRELMRLRGAPAIDVHID